jgi:hypothetical protein
MLQPADAIFVGQGMNLIGEVGVEFHIRASFLNRLEEVGPAWKFHAARLIPQAVAKPDKIFGGLKRLGFDDGCCYCSRQEKRWETTKRQVAIPKNLLFLVYAEAMSGSFVVFDWGFRAEDANKPGFPQGWEDFERGLVWPLS